MREREREREREEREKEQYFKIGINSYTSTLLQIHVDICYELNDESLLILLINIDNFVIYLLKFYLNYTLLQYIIFAYQL